MLREHFADLYHCKRSIWLLQISFPWGGGLSKKCQNGTELHKESSIFCTSISVVRSFKLNWRSMFLVTKSSWISWWLVFVTILIRSNWLRTTWTLAFHIFTSSDQTRDFNILFSRFSRNILGLDVCQQIVARKWLLEKFSSSQGRINFLLLLEN